jgi:hypothetical protein
MWGISVGWTLLSANCLQRSKPRVPVFSCIFARENRPVVTRVSPSSCGHSDSVLCFSHLGVLNYGKHMKRLTARFLLLFAIVGTFVPLAIAVTTPPAHACCLRKAPHQCHGSGSEEDQRSIRTTDCCNHDCCRAVTTSRSAIPQSSLSPFVSQNIDARVVELPVNTRPTERFSTQSTRAPPRISLS